MAKFRVVDADGVAFITDNYIEACNESMKIKAAHYRETGEKRRFPVELVQEKKGGR